MDLKSLFFVDSYTGPIDFWAVLLKQGRAVAACVCVWAHIIKLAETECIHATCNGALRCSASFSPSITGLSSLRHARLHHSPAFLFVLSCSLSDPAAIWRESNDGGLFTAALPLLLLLIE